MSLLGWTRLVEAKGPLAIAGRANMFLAFIQPSEVTPIAVTRVACSYRAQLRCRGTLRGTGVVISGRGMADWDLSKGEEKIVSVAVGFRTEAISVRGRKTLSHIVQPSPARH